MVVKEGENKRRQKTNKKIRMHNKEHGREKGIDETAINVKNKQPKNQKGNWVKYKTNPKKKTYRKLEKYKTVTYTKQNKNIHCKANRRRLNEENINHTTTTHSCLHVFNNGNGGNTRSMGNMQFCHQSA